MDLITFILHDSPASLGNVFCFITKQSSELITKIFKKKFEMISSQMMVIDLLDSPAALKAHLDMSFLGEVSVFWLTEDLLAQNPIVHSFLSTYGGPNFVGYTTKTVPAQSYKGLLITVPEEVTYEQFTQLFAFIYPSQSVKCTALVKQIFKLHAVLTLPSALLVMHYCILVGTRSEAFLQDWVPTLLNPERSLFILSSLLFAKKEQQFFQLWTRMSADYSDPFWTTYWSEQLFKATLFCSFMQAKNYAQAKRVSYRLPFSFVQKDWKLFSIEELKRAHDHLYVIDWNIKNGLTAHFEHFYLHCMLTKNS